METENENIRNLARSKITLKNLIKNRKPESLSEVCACSERPALKNKYQSNTFKHSQELQPKESKVSSETRNGNPSTLRH